MTQHRAARWCELRVTGRLLRKAPLLLVAAAMVMPAGLEALEKRRSGPIRLSPAQAVMNAAEMPGGISGVFEMVVRATGRRGSLLYLNSEADYRDPRNLTVVVSAGLEQDLAARIGRPVETVIRGKVIAVRGTARKTRIDFLADGQPTGKYYFQTHLNLRSARDLTVEGERPLP